MEENFILTVLIAFLASMFLNSYFMHFVLDHLKQRALFQPDINKIGRKRNVPALGGIAGFGAFMTIISIFIIMTAFDKNPLIQTNYLLLSLLSLSVIAFIGLVDDVLIFSHRILKPLLIALACIPLMAVNLPNNLIMHIPFIGNINWGIYYAFIFVPLAVIFVSNAVNILAGLDGLVPGMASIVAATLLFVSYLKGNEIAIIYFAILLPTQLILFYFNKPASLIFPGNIGTLFAGGAIAIGAIIGNVERSLVILMIPYFIHFLFYSRSFFKFVPKMMGRLQRNGTLKCPYDKCYGLTHWIMKYMRNSTERRIVWRLILFEVVIAVFVIILEYFKIPLF